MFKKLFGFGKKKDKEAEQEVDVEIDVEEDAELKEAEDGTHETQEEVQDKEEEIEIEEVQNPEEIQDEAVQDKNEAQNQAEETPVQEAETQREVQVQETEAEESEIEQIEEIEEIETAESEEVEEAESESVEETEPETEIVEDAEPEFEESEKPAPKGFFSRLKEGLSKTTQNFTSKLDNLFKGYKTIDAEIYEELEEILITADVGFDTTLKITQELKRREIENKIEEVDKLQEELEKIIEEILVNAPADQDLESEDELEAATPESVERKQKVMVVVGVNGVGKTTSIGKLAFQLKNEGNNVMLAAADTFRAAATEQLVIWAERAEVPIVKHGEGADPSAVIFDAIKAAKDQNVDILICDTAGRLHNKKNLMNELEKVFKIINREFPEAEKEVLLVIDATTGQNAINQAKVFKEAAPLTGLILTKLDGTAKGGVVLGIISELSLPIKYIGVGEKIEDLQIFEAKSFARALFGRNM